MEYVIFVFVVTSILWLHHRNKYLKSNYGKFEYYLCGETKSYTKNLLLLYEMFTILVLIILIIFLGGESIKFVYDFLEVR